jgi:hypothetical protein
VTLVHRATGLNFGSSSYWSLSNPDTKVGRLHKPTVLRLPILKLHTEIKVSDNPGDEFRHFQNGDVFSKARPSPEAELQSSVCYIREK